MTEAETIRAIARALAKYRKTGARDLPSVRKSVPRPFRDAVDEFERAIAAALGKEEGR